MQRCHRTADDAAAFLPVIKRPHAVFSFVPYAGVNKSGLGGGVLSVDTLFDYWRSLSVVRPL